MIEILEKEFSELANVLAARHKEGLEDLLKIIVKVVEAKIQGEDVTEHMRILKSILKDYKSIATIALARTSVQVGEKAGKILLSLAKELIM